MIILAARFVGRTLFNLLFLFLRPLLKLLFRFSLAQLTPLSGIPTEQTYHFPVLSEVIGTNIFHIVSKAFIKPQVIPPLHSDQVTKPLVRKLVSHNYGHILFVSGARGGRVTQHVGFAECEYSPVLHGSSRKIRHSDQV